MLSLVVPIQICTSGLMTISCWTPGDPSLRVGGHPEW